MPVDHSKHLGLSDQHIAGDQEQMAQLISTLTKKAMSPRAQNIKSYQDQRNLVFLPI
jgi:hypothetical protein